MKEHAISAVGIQKAYGAKRILNNVTLGIGAGVVCGLVGLNGAGKTTLIRCLLGLLKPDAGDLAIMGETPKHERRFYRRIGVVLEHEGFYGNLTIEENLAFYAAAKALPRGDRESYYSRWWSDTAISDKRQKTKTLSRGQRMQCALCRAFMGEPAALFLDEPAASLDVHAYDHFCAMVRHARSEGAAVLISSHQLEAIEELCDMTVILENGALTYMNNQTGALARRWFIRAPHSESHEQTIARLTGKPLFYRGGRWEFAVSADDADCIPRVIAALVRQGCRIDEVSRLEGSFRSSIRNHYSKD